MAGQAPPTNRAPPTNQAPPTHRAPPTHQGLLQLGDVHVEHLVGLLHVEDGRALDAVQELTAGHADAVLAEVPVEEDARGDDPLVIDVTVEAVVLAAVAAELGLAEDWAGWGGGGGGGAITH